MILFLSTIPLIVLLTFKKELIDFYAHTRVLIFFIRNIIQTILVTNDFMRLIFIHCTFLYATHKKKEFLNVLIPNSSVLFIKPKCLPANSNSIRWLATITAIMLTCLHPNYFLIMFYIQFFLNCEFFIQLSSVLFLYKLYATQLHHHHQKFFLRISCERNSIFLISHVDSL